MVEIILGIGSFELSLGEAATFDDISGFLPTDRVEGLDEALYDKADKADVYTKGEVDTKLDSKANASEVYTKAETNTLLDNKANVSDLANKQNTLTAGDNITIVDDVISASGSVDDVQINGTSIVVDKVANIPYASEGVYGVTTVTESELANKANQAELENGNIDTAISPTIIPNEVAQILTGEIVSYSGFNRTDYINVDGYDFFKTSRDCSNCCYYDLNKFWISPVVKDGGGYGSGANHYNAIPNGTKYLIISDGAPHFENVTISLAKRSFAQKVANKNTSFDGEYVVNNILLQNTIGVKKYPNNLVDFNDCIDNHFVDYSNGKIVANNNYFCTGFIPVVPGTAYRANHGRNYAWYKSDGECLSGASGTAIQTSITAPTNASYIRFTINKTSDGIVSPFDLYFTTVADFNTNVVIDGLKLTDWCYGKKVNWLGDSIVAGQDFDEEVCSALGLVKNNEYGIDGSSIALATNGTNPRNACCLRYSNMTNDADIIVVSCGTNDFEYALCPIGDIDSTENNTFYGALKTLCEGLINKYPQKVICFTTPIKRAQPFADGNGGTYTPDGEATTPFSKNKYGKTLGDYADIIKEVCGYYSIPVLDMYRESLLNPHLPSQQNMFDSALTHPNTTGQKIMARRVSGWLAQLGYTISGLT